MLPCETSTTTPAGILAHDPLAGAAAAERLRVVRRNGTWWITGMPLGGADCGPYTTKALATLDRRGLARTLRHGHQRRFWTSERKAKSGGSRVEGRKKKRR